MTLDFIGSVILMGALLVSIFVFTNALQVSASTRIGIAAIAGAWTGMQLGLYQAGVFQTAFATQVPVVGIMVALPLVIVGIAAIASGRVRSVLMAVPLDVPLELSVGLNIMRVFGALFLFLAVAGRLSGPFPTSAGWGDVITGIVAVPLAIQAARGTANPAAILGWNAFGAADLVAAVALGVTSSPGSPLQIFAESSSDAVQHMPYLLIPTVFVPFYLILHGIVFAQLRQQRAATVRA